MTYATARDPDIGVLDVAIPVVLECDAGFLSDNRHQTVTAADVHRALDTANTGPVAEGCVGAGTGTQQFDFKGGIGTSSRLVEIGGAAYTIGVLLQTNYGSRRQLSILGRNVGRQITDLMPDHHQEGSCVGVVATDIPLNPLQLQRLTRRVGVGLARTGSVGNDGSGEIFVAFSVANRIPRSSPTQTTTVRSMIEGQFWTQGSPFDLSSRRSPTQPRKPRSMRCSRRTPPPDGTETSCTGFRSSESSICSEVEGRARRGREPQRREGHVRRRGGVGGRSEAMPTALRAVASSRRTSGERSSSRWSQCEQPRTQRGG